VTPVATVATAPPSGGRAAVPTRPHDGHRFATALAAVEGAHLQTPGASGDASPTLAARDPRPSTDATGQPGAGGPTPDPVDAIETPAADLATSVPTAIPAPVGTAGIQWAGSRSTAGQPVVDGSAETRASASPTPARSGAAMPRTAQLGESESSRVPWGTPPARGGAASPGEGSSGAAGAAGVGGAAGSSPTAGAMSGGQLTAASGSTIGAGSSAAGRPDPVAAHAAAMGAAQGAAQGAPASSGPVSDPDRVRSAVPATPLAVPGPAAPGANGASIIAPATAAAPTLATPTDEAQTSAAAAMSRAAAGGAHAPGDAGSAAATVAAGPTPAHASSGGNASSIANAAGAAHALPAQHAAFAAQLSRPLLRLANAGGGDRSITVTVAPEQLGPVTVRAVVGADGLRLELSAPTEQGREALRQVLGDLRRDLAATGSGATLDLGSSGPGGGLAQREASAGPEASARPSRPAEPATLPSRASAAALTWHPSSTLDTLA